MLPILASKQVFVGFLSISHTHTSWSVPLTSLFINVTVTTGSTLPQQACWTRLATRLLSHPLAGLICRGPSRTPTRRRPLQAPMVMATRMDSCPMVIAMEPRPMAHALLAPPHRQSTLEPAHPVHSNDPHHPLGTAIHCHIRERTARILVIHTITRIAATKMRITSILMEARLTSITIRNMARTRCRRRCPLTSTLSQDPRVGSLRDRMVKATVAQTARAQK